MRRRLPVPVTLAAVALLGIAGCLPSLAQAPTDVPSIQAEIESTYAGQFSSVGVGAHGVEVTLFSTHEASAREIVDRYGSSVQVSVGLWPFPRPAGGPTTCPERWSLADPGPLRATLDMPNRIGHGQFKARITVTNVGDIPISLDSGQPLLIYLYKPNGADPIATYDGTIAGVGLVPTLDAGGSFSIEAVGGTASCDISLGYDLPDGDYVARGVVENGSGSPIPAFLTDPFPVTVVQSP
jgi:hypothetical protein